LSPPAQVAVRSRPRDWVNNAIRLIEADAHRSADTHLLRYPLPSAWSDNAGIELYLKDETTHITGSLKHRLARSLFLYALCNGWISEDTTVVEASSGSTAVSEACFAAAARHASAVLGRRVGASTGTNLWGAFGLLAEMVADGRSGSVVTLRRQRRPLRRHLLLRRVAQDPGTGHIRTCHGPDRIRTLGPLGLIPGLVNIAARSGNQQPQHS
jgi:hypothetical protein